MVFTKTTIEEYIKNHELLKSLYAFCHTDQENQEKLNKEIADRYINLKGSNKIKSSKDILLAENIIGKGL